MPYFRPDTRVHPDLYTTPRGPQLARDVLVYATSLRAQAAVAGFTNLDPISRQAGGHRRPARRQRAGTQPAAPDITIRLRDRMSSA